MSEYLNFAEISQQIPFKQVLNWLCLPYTERKNELKGKIGEDTFIASTDKNTFFCPKNEHLKGGIINLTSQCLNLSLRDAALALKVQFLTEPPKPKREIPNLELHYCKFLEKQGITQDTAQEYEIGLVKQKSIITGRICFKIYDHEGNHTGYIGYSEEKKDWFFPKNFKRPLYNYSLFKDREEIILTTNPFTSLILCQNGHPSCSLIGKSMTESQEEALKTFNRIILIHKEPENVILRLIPYTFVKTAEIESFKTNSVE